APSSGETIVHVGAGTGYYTALLSLLALPKGRVQAYESEASLAERATKDLASFEGGEVTHGDATQTDWPDCHLIYVNAGVVAPPAAWLKALRPGGRIIFPWSPSNSLGITLMLTRGQEGFAVRPLGPSWFIPCVGASDPDVCIKVPSIPEARSITTA